MSLSSNAGQDMKKRITLDIQIAVFTFDIISFVQFTINNYI